MTTAYDLTGAYGPEWRTGLLVDNLPRAEALGFRVVTLTRTQWLVTEDGTAVPVVCGDIIRLWTEDGPTDGRCGTPIVPGRGACEGHAAERDAYFELSEAERAYNERVAEYDYA